jgi:hypothetical protein
VFAPDDSDDAVDRPSGYAWASVDDLAHSRLSGDRDNVLLRIQDTDLPVTGSREHGSPVVWVRSRDTVMRRDAE